MTMDMQSNHQIRNDQFDLSFKVFHELMAKKVNDILLISSPYDAFIMEEEGRLAERIIHEYRGLNLSRPPMLTRVSTAQDAMALLASKHFDLVITMPQVDDTDAAELARTIKSRFPELPIILMAHNTNRQLLERAPAGSTPIDSTYIWQGNSDLLLALIKSIEDTWNVSYDTQRARVRVILLVEDSPAFRSFFLPLLYKEIVTQTQAAMEESLNDEHRIFRMRARPKVLVADNYESALALYHDYKPFLLSIFSDTRFAQGGRIDDQAGVNLLRKIRTEKQDLPLLLMSSERRNRQLALDIPAVFLDKNSSDLSNDIRHFFKQFLGFGDFIFRLPNGNEIARASNLREMEMVLPTIPDASMAYHAERNHFSSWLMARSEVMLASRLKPVKVSDFSSPKALNQYLVECLNARRKGRQRGIITAVTNGNYDPVADFIKIGKGSLGGKARGLAFMASQLKAHADSIKNRDKLEVRVPKTLVLSTDCFDAFTRTHRLRDFAAGDFADREVMAAFTKPNLPEDLRSVLASFLDQARYPLAVRSSSLLEDAQFQPFAGLYKTYMLPNNHADLNTRLRRLEQAIKLVYASTYYKAPKAYARSTAHRTEDEQMAVVVQQLTGKVAGNHFYPALSGVAQSFNYYPLAHLRPEQGIAHLAMGLGKIVVEGGIALRFSPKFPQFLPQFSTVDDILQNSQRFFYALKLKDFPPELGIDENDTLDRLDVDAHGDHSAVQWLASTYSIADHRIRDGLQPSGHPVLTFANVLKYGAIPLADCLSELLTIGRRGMGCPVEIEFAVDGATTGSQRPNLDLLQIRPMAITAGRMMDVEVTSQDVENAILYSEQALGNGQSEDIADIVFVDPQTFDPSQTTVIASEIGKFNQTFIDSGKKYLLIGPGRWGSADRWLGIPVRWNDISEVGAMVETTAASLKADPSQGSHFFHNITSLGISYITISDDGRDFLDWQWLAAAKRVSRSQYLVHSRPDQALTIKVDGRQSRAVVLP